MALYEIRTYTLYVGKMAEAQKLYTELGFPALKKGGHDKNLVGYFVADTGMINQLVHIWKFKDDGDRRAHWAAVFANKDFVEGFASKFRPLVIEPGGEADDRGAVGAASVRGRCQTPSRVAWSLTASLEVSHLRIECRHNPARSATSSRDSTRAIWSCEPESRIIVMKKLCARW